MTWRRPGRLRVASATTATILGGMSLLLVLAAIPLEALNPGALSVNGSTDAVSRATGIVFVLTFAAVGVVVARHQPHNPMGWLLLSAGLVWQLGDYVPSYAYLDYRIHNGRLPLGHVALLFDSVFFYGMLLVPLIILLFPDGRLGSRWRWPLRAYVAACVIDVAATLTVPIADFHLRQPLDSSGNLIGGGTHFANHWVDQAAAVSVVALFALSISAVVYQVRNYRRASGERRQQLKWLGSGAAIFVVVLPTMLWHTAPSIVGDLLPLGLTAVPITIGMAILKYRLYEIDRLISRTLTYTTVTALLAGIFFSLVILTTRVLPLSSPIGVAAATLTAAALFNPLRTRIQHLIDRRFNRAHYNAEATITNFRNRLRDAVDLDTIQTELVTAVSHAVQPTHITIWIKPHT